MMLNLIVLLLIVLTTLYLATQGLLSSLLALGTAIFSSILAMALMEVSQGIIAGWRPEYARGVTFLVLFLVIFSITRVVADVMVPENIKLPLWVNRIGGGTIGFFTSLVVIGSVLLGIEMLPLPRVIMGFDRFPDENAMQAMDEKPQLGEVSRKRKDVWFWPDNFVLAIWKGGSRGLGGTPGWTAIHPDFMAENYGYRNNVVRGSLRVVPADLFKVDSVWIPTDKAESDSLKKQVEAGLADPKRNTQNASLSPTRDQLIVVRTEVKKGEKEPKVTNDPNDNYFRITATQIRLVTDKRQQYYPIGYLDGGRNFVPMPLDGGHVADDYVKRGSDQVVVEDWVFQVGSDEKPKIIEMKELGRADISGDLLRDKRPALSTAYPPHEYLKEQSTLIVQFDPGGKRLEEANVYLLVQDADHRSIESELNSAFGKLETIESYIGDSKNGWSRDPKPGVPDVGVLDQAYRNGKNYKNDLEDVPRSWQELLPVFLCGQATSNGEQNLNIYPRYFQETLIPMWKAGRKGNMLISPAKADANGKAELPRIVAGKYEAVCTMRTDRGFYVWSLPQDMSRATQKTVNLSPSTQPMFKIDLDAAR